MTAVLLYKPNQRWQIWVAFAGAALLHVAAVALAERNQAPRETRVIEGPPDDVIAIDPPELPRAVETPPPDVMPPPPPVSDPVFPEENATPPPVRNKRERPSQPLTRPPSRPASLPAIGSAKVLALTAPPPDYPYEARRQRATGSGIASLTIDPRSGSVLDVRMTRSTGNAVLDNAAISGFQRWRFKARTRSPVQAPITFTLTGAAY
jgi:TonB family protein